MNFRIIWSGDRDRGPGVLDSRQFSTQKEAEEAAKESLSKPDNRHTRAEIVQTVSTARRTAIIETA